MPNPECSPRASRIAGPARRASAAWPGPAARLPKLARFAKVARLKSDEFIREVDEELQREKLGELWKRYGGLLAGAAVAVVLATAGWVGWQRWQEQRRDQEAASFAERELVARSGNSAEAVAGLLDFARDASPGFAAVARLHAAALAGRAADEAGALAALDAVAADGRADPLLRDAARLLAASRRIEIEDPRSLVASLEPFAADGAPWRHAARQLLAAAQLRAGARPEAVATLRRLVEDAEAPAGLRGRAAELLEALGAPQARSTS